MSALLNNCNPSSSHCMHAAGIGESLTGPVPTGTWKPAMGWEASANQPHQRLDHLSKLPTLGFIYLFIASLYPACRPNSVMVQKAPSLNLLCNLEGVFQIIKRMMIFASIFSSGEENTRETDILKGSEYQCFSVETQGLLSIFSFREVKETNKRGGSQRRKCHRF